MAFGSLNKDQKDAIHKIIRGKVVTDLGAGDLVLAKELIKLGATSIIAVDHTRTHVKALSPEITYVIKYFSDLRGPIDLAFLSWPINYGDTGLEMVIKRCKTVIYLGQNLGGTACGSPTMFKSLVKREVVAHVPDKKNTLIIYGQKKVKRVMFQEEYAAIHQNEILYFDKDWVCPILPTKRSKTSL